MIPRVALVALGSCLLFSCSEGSNKGSSQPNGASSAATATAGSDTASAATKATVGQPAPDFSLQDLEGNTVSLASFKGKTVVLEWFNPECPFVKASHNKGSLKDLAKGMTDKGVVWLAINSGAAGKQGAGVEKNKAGATAFGLSHPILLDENGAVGKLYGATNTPHMFVIDAQGKLVYAGAIDNSPDGEGDSPEGGTLVNFVSDAVDATVKGDAVKVASSKAYGCGVKY